MLLTFILLSMLGFADRTGYQYKAFQDSGTWYGFNEKCKSRGYAGLASITNAAEQATACRACLGGIAYQCFIGGVQTGGEGPSGYSWIDGSEWGYVYWHNDGLNNNLQSNPEDVIALTYDCAWHDMGTQHMQRSMVMYLCGGNGEPTPYPTNLSPIPHPTPTPPPTEWCSPGSDSGDISGCCGDHYPETGCPSGFGDCGKNGSSDSECAEGLVCVSDVGLEHGYNEASTDVCLPAPCSPGSVNGDVSGCCGDHYPETGCPSGFGDCGKNGSSDSECAEGLVCVSDVGLEHGYKEANTDVCLPGPTPPPSDPPQEGPYCSPYSQTGSLPGCCGLLYPGTGCPEGYGDCGKGGVDDSECAEGLTCVPNIGAFMGFSGSETDVCLKVENRDPTPKPTPTPPVPSPTERPPVPNPTLRPTDGPEHDCSEFDGDKRGCLKAHERIPGMEECSWDKFTNKCQSVSITCDSFSKYKWKCPAKSDREIKMTCYWDDSTGTCVADKPVYECSDFEGKKKCRKLGKPMWPEGGCKWDKFQKLCVVPGTKSPCTAYNKKIACTDAGCYWDLGTTACYDEEPEHKTCIEIDNQRICQSSGCVWQGASPSGCYERGSCGQYRGEKKCINAGCKWNQSLSLLNQVACS